MQVSLVVLTYVCVSDTLGTHVKPSGHLDAPVLFRGDIWPVQASGSLLGLHKLP